jgi:hypothetical protein
LLARTWRVFDGPEWTDSVKEADPADEYFARNLEAIKIWLERDPHYGSHALVDGNDDLRVYKTKDEAAGYRLIVVIHCDVSAKTVECRWLHREQL